VRRALPLLIACACVHGLPAGSPLPPVSVHTLGGEQVRLDRLSGPALVALWATTCLPCARSQRVRGRPARETGLHVIAISIDLDYAPVRAWPARHPASPFEVLRDPDGSAAEEVGMKQMPTSFLLDAGGRVRARYEGFREEDETVIERDVRALLASR